MMYPCKSILQSVSILAVGERMTYFDEQTFDGADGFDITRHDRPAVDLLNDVPVAGNTLVRRCADRSQRALVIAGPKTAASVPGGYNGRRLIPLAQKRYQPFCIQRGLQAECRAVPQRLNLRIALLRDQAQDAERLEVGDHRLRSAAFESYSAHDFTSLPS